MCYHILVSRSPVAAAYSDLGEEARCVERLLYLCHTEPSLSQEIPLSHSFDESQPAG